MMIITDIEYNMSCEHRRGKCNLWNMVDGLPLVLCLFNYTVCNAKNKDILRVQL